jgi:hypothetical protein
MYTFDIQTYTWSTINVIGLIPRPRCQMTLMHFISTTTINSNSSIINKKDNSYIILYGGACHYENTDVSYTLIMTLSFISIIT